MRSKDHVCRGRLKAGKGEALQQVWPALYPTCLSLLSTCCSCMLRWQCLRCHQPKKYWHTDAEHGEKKINFWEGPTRISEWKEEQVR